MENEKICSNCGKSNENTASYCSNCGKSLVQNNVMNSNSEQSVNNSNINIEGVTNNNQTTNKSEKEGDVFALLSLLFYFLGSTAMEILAAHIPGKIGYAFSTLGGICPLVGIVLMIVGRTKYPNNKFLKGVMWAIFISIVIGIIVLSIISIYCATACSATYMECTTMDTSGCS
jgi:hypothetical protein